MQSKFILIADPKILSIPILENEEPLINIKNQDEILFGPSPEIENNTVYTKMRHSVYERLLEAQRNLPHHLRLCLYEGLRTLELQKALYQKRWETVKAAQPDAPDSEIFDEVIRMVSPVETLDGTQNIPPHATGAAVDVYLVDKSGNPVDMGILAKDWASDLVGELSETASTAISDEAKWNRKILSSAMQAAGFVNYPSEYWHWSYGDRYWAYATQQPNAIYGTVHQF